MKRLRNGRMKSAERNAALAAIKLASSKHRHVAIRPERKWEDRRSPGMEIDPRAPNIGRQLDRAVDAGFAATPDDDWEVFGCSDQCEAPDDADVPDAFAWWSDPIVYGQFTLNSFDTDDQIDDGLGAGPGTWRRGGR